MSVRIGFIGTGHIAGSQHIVNLANMEDVELGAFADTDISKAEKYAVQYGGKAYEDYREMLDKEKLSAVFLCTPHLVRYEPIKAIAERNMALFCEKPPAFDLASAKESLKAIEKTKVINSVGFMYRWAKVTEKAKEMIAHRPVSICRITGCWSVLYWNMPWLYLKDKSGGPILEQGIHLIDVARFILEDEIIETHAFGTNKIVPKSESVTVEDTISLNLKFASGTVGSHIHSWSHHGWIFQLEFIGKDFQITLDLTAGNRVYGIIDGVEVNFHGSDNYYQTEVKEFVEAVGKKDQSIIRSCYADAVRSLAVCLAANKSLETGKPEKITS